MVANSTVRFNFPVKIISGIQAISSVPDEIMKLGGSRPVIITDKGIIAAGLLEKIIHFIKENMIQFSIFDGVEPDPTTGIVEQATRFAEEKGCDLVIAVGGGSSIDTAKATSIMITNKGKVADYEGITSAYKAAPLPVIAIPTTAGTGSEVSSAAMITDEERKMKMLVKSEQIFPKVAILDPLMLVKIPPEIAAETGMDALTHAIEAYISNGRTFVTDSLALNAIRILFENIRSFVGNTSDIFVALNMLNASCLAGAAMTTGGLGLVHAMAHPLGIYGKISHGLACTLLLPHVLEHNMVSSIERYGHMALAANPFHSSNFMGSRDLALKIIDEIHALIDDLKLPKSSHEAGVALSLTDHLIDAAYHSRLTQQINPRSTSRDDVIRIFGNILK
jgi:alcohol dehydrogenase class IV